MNLHRFEFQGQRFIFHPESLRLLPATSGGSSPLGMGLDEPATPVADLPDCNRIEILVNTTQRCNLTCPYCFVDQGRFSYKQERPGDLTPALARQLIHVLPEAIPDAAEYCIHFYGGEPLMNLDAIDAAVTAANTREDHRFSFSVTTNGTMDPGTVVPLLAKGHFSVILSIDGPAPIHDAIRRDVEGNPTHGKVLDFLFRIKQEGGLFVRGSSVIRHGWRLKDAERYLETLPVDAIKAQAVRLPADHPLSLTEKEREQYFGDLDDVATSVIESIRREELPLDDRFNSRVLQLVCSSRRESFCGAGISIFGMACNGTMYPCILHAGNEELALGHIGDPGHGWVKKGQEWAKSRRRGDDCMGCFALPLCGGGCPAMLAVCGEDECEYTRKVAELAIAIYGSIPHKPDLLVLAGID